MPGDGPLQKTHMVPSRLVRVELVVALARAETAAVQAAPEGGFRRLVWVAHARSESAGNARRIQGSRMLAKPNPTRADDRRGRVAVVQVRERALQDRSVIGSTGRLAVAGPPDHPAEPQRSSCCPFGIGAWFATIVLRSIHSRVYCASLLVGRGNGVPKPVVTTGLRSMDSLVWWPLSREMPGDYAMATTPGVLKTPPGEASAHTCDVAVLGHASSASRRGVWGGVGGLLNPERLSPCGNREPTTQRLSPRCPSHRHQASRCGSGRRDAPSGAACLAG